MAPGTQKRRTSQEGEEPNYCLFCRLRLFSLKVRTDLTIPESTWVKKQEDIANGICKLGAGYCQVLCDGWVRYFAQKNAAASGGAGQSSQQVDIGKKEWLVVGDDE